MTTTIGTQTDEQRRVLTSLTERQKQVLLALDGGELTALELASKLEIPVKEIEKALESLHKFTL